VSDSVRLGQAYFYLGEYRLALEIFRTPVSLSKYPRQWGTGDPGEFPPSQCIGFAAAATRICCTVNSNARSFGLRRRGGCEDAFDNWDASYFRKLAPADCINALGAA
jgi:hypothetical protein